MKKFLACVFILAIFSGVIFYFGWTQFRVKPDTIGIVVSKTNGIDDKPVQNGEFAWHWQFLLPTNATLKTFHIKPVESVKTISGALPSGEAYAAIYGAEGLFNYSFTFDISLTVSPEAVVELMNFILSKAQDNPDFRAESLRREEILRGIQIYKDFPEIDVSVFSIQNSKLPDYKMYKKIQNMQPDELSGQDMQRAQPEPLQEEI